MKTVNRNASSNLQGAPRPSAAGKAAREASPHPRIGSRRRSLGRAGRPDGASSQTLDADLVQLRVEVPGRPYSRYDLVDGTGQLRLAEIIYPAEWRPVDLCSAPEALSGGGASLPALLVGSVSHPIGCLLWARPIALLVAGDGPGAPRYLVAAAADDPAFASSNPGAALSHANRMALEAVVRSLGLIGEEDLQWLGADAAFAEVRAARRRFHLAKVEQGANLRLNPAWKPLQAMPGQGEVESAFHTASEFSFYALPYRFQKYVEEYLTNDERILWAIQRPTMQSHLRRRFFSRARLEEGVFIISDQQLTEVVELLPPDSAGIRYGFVARTSVPERLGGVEVRRVRPDGICLEVSLRASHGCEQLIWEFPGWREEAVAEAARILRQWLPQQGDRRVRRASLPEPPEELPALRDPAANDPADVVPLADRLIDRLTRSLFPGEKVLARCLLPAWVEGRGGASLVAITSGRFLVIPDPANPRTASPEVDVPLDTISSLEFCSTLVMAYLKLFVPQRWSPRPDVINIPFGKTLAAMNACHMMLRRAMATAVPASAAASGSVL